MTRFKNWFINWLGISHMASEVYSKLLREHENRLDQRYRERQTDYANQMQEMLRQHCSDESAMRDGFASNALQGIIANAFQNAGPERYELRPDFAAKYAYLYADAMLYERKNKQ